MTDPERRHRRPAVSCSLCRKRKIRCDRKAPCNNCLRSRNGSCVYENQPSQPPRQNPGPDATTELVLSRVNREPHNTRPNSPASSISRTSTVPSQPSMPLTASSISASTPASQTSDHDVESMKTKIREMEHQLSKVTHKPAQSPVQISDSMINTTESSMAGTFHILTESSVFGQVQFISRSVFHKNRLFGQSHWCNGVILFRDILEMIEPCIRREAWSSSSKCLAGIQRCKSLARVIKSRRAPSWPTLPSADLPLKDVCDQLIECYLRTYETVYRILHIPTFKKDYDAFWAHPNGSSVMFLVQLKLVLAIGATTYDERFSLRSAAIRWVYETQTWISEPEFKSRLSIQYLQTNLLLLLARETTAVGQDMVWISAGALLRTAIHMGLHRDPARLPKRTPFYIEMRRRLWNTILEISLQSSLHSGGPPLVSLEYFDTEPPRNFDDDQLLTEDPTPKPEECFTQASIAIALRKTLAIRLAIANSLNNLCSHNTYEETLSLDTELRVAHKTLSQSLHSWTSSHGRPPSKFAIRVVDLLMRRYLASLHIPFFGPGLHETAFAFSRKVVIDTSLKIWCASYPSSTIMAAQSRNVAISPAGCDDFERLVINGSGFFRIAAIQAVFLIAMELKTQLQEEESLGPVPLRPDLLSVLEDAKTWSLKCSEAGETNIKGYLLISLVSAQIEGLMRGLTKDEFPALLVKAAEHTGEKCLPMLERMMIQSQTEGVVAGPDRTGLNAMPELTEDWDNMMPNGQFDFLNADPMTWLFDHAVEQEPFFFGDGEEW